MVLADNRMKSPCHLKISIWNNFVEFYQSLDHKARKVQTTALQIWPAFTSGFGRNAASDYRVIEMDLPDFGKEFLILD